MNILKHKSWHVWNRDNIAKVRRDEQQHEVEEAEKRRRQNEIDSEKRIDRLRQELGKTSKSSTEVNQGQQHQPSQLPPQMTLTDRHGHFNLFPDIEKKLSTNTGKNPEREAEDKAKKEREDRMFRHTPLNDDRNGTPWYIREGNEANAGPKSMIEAKVVDRRNQSHDPLLDINEYLKVKQSHDEGRDIKTLSGVEYYQHVRRNAAVTEFQQQRQEASSAPVKAIDIDKEKSKKRKRESKSKDKRKKKSKHRRRSSSSSSSSDDSSDYSSSSSESDSSSSSSSSSDRSRGKRKSKSRRKRSKHEEPAPPVDTMDPMMKLREERLRREALEQARVAALLNPSKSTRRDDGRSSTGSTYRHSQNSQQYQRQHPKGPPPNSGGSKNSSVRMRSDY